MAGPPGYTEEHTSLLERCLLQEADAMTELACLPPDNPVCEQLLRQSLAGDRSASRILLQFAVETPVRVEWEQRRMATRDSVLEGWKKRHDAFVRSVIRKYLARLPDDVDDVVQEFWFSFWKNDGDAKYDPARVTESERYTGQDAAVANTYVFVKARGKAFSHLRKEYGETAIFTPLPQVEKEPEVPVAQFDRTGLIRYLNLQVTTNQLKPHILIVWLCARFSGLGPTELARDHLQSTLAGLWKLVEGEMSFAHNLEMGRLVRSINDRLNLPPEQPLGMRTLTQLVEERAEGGADGRHQEPSAAEVFQYWVDDAKRTFDREIKAPSLDGRERLADQVRFRVEREIRSRLDFLVQSEHRATAPEFFLNWAWRMILNLPAKHFNSLACRQASSDFAARIRNLIPGYHFPAGFDALLAGGCAEKPIVERLDAFGANSDSAEKAIEQLYQAWRRSRPNED
jgi:DNA-directed RNA polymerase specialized sigma24 family protein